MDSIQKFLSKLSSKERQVLLLILQKIMILDLDSLDVKKLAGPENLCRVRKGKIRIVFKQQDGKGVVIMVDYRNSMYKKLGK